MITTAKWTLEQYHQIIDAGILEGQPVELLNGEIVVDQPLLNRAALVSISAPISFRELRSEAIKSALSCDIQ